MVLSSRCGWAFDLSAFYAQDAGVLRAAQLPSAVSASKMQHHTAKSVYDRLKAEHGYYSIGINDPCLGDGGGGSTKRSSVPGGNAPRFFLGLWSTMRVDARSMFARRLLRWLEWNRTLSEHMNSVN